MVATRPPDPLPAPEGSTLLEARLRLRHPGCLAELLPQGATLVQLSSDRSGGLFFLTAGDLQPVLDRFARDARFRALVVKRDGHSAVLRLVGQLPCPHGEGEALTLWPYTYRDGEERGRLLFAELMELRAFVGRREGRAHVHVEGTSFAPLGAVPVSISVSGLAGALTAKQLEVLRTAVMGGYYDIPRAVTTEALAKRFDISRTTYDEHLRKGEQALLRQFLQLLASYPELGAGARKPRGRPKRAA